MENIAENATLLFKRVTQYSKSSLELLQLKTIDKVSDVLSSLSLVFCMIILLAMFTLFITIGFGFLIGQLLNNTALGFFAVSLFYLLLALIVYVFRTKLIIIPVGNLIISKFIDKEDLEQKEDLLKDN